MLIFSDFLYKQLCHLQRQFYFFLSNLDTINLFIVYLFYLLRQGLTITQAKAHWWDYKHVPPYSANFCIFVETGFHYVAQAGLNLLGSSNLPFLAPQSVGIAGVSHHTWKLNSQSSELALTFAFKTLFLYDHLQCP